MGASCSIALQGKAKTGYPRVSRGSFLSGYGSFLCYYAHFLYILFPSFRILTAAFTSRSIRFPHSHRYLYGYLSAILYIYGQFCYHPTILAPNGIRDSFAILKNCFPNRIPTIVMHHRRPKIRFPSAISHPKNRSHIRLTKNENIPFPYTISLPDGQNAREANLKHCSPTVIPTIVIHQTHPAKTQESPLINPPNKNQRINLFIDFILTLMGCLYKTVFIWQYQAVKA